MKKTLLSVLPALLIGNIVFAEEGGEKKGKFMDTLTEEQKACIEQHGCPKIEFKKGEEKPEGWEEARVCRNKAFEACGIEKPERPEGEKKFKKESEE